MSSIERQQPIHFFISYSRKDSEVVLPVVAELESRGLRCWVDRSILTGSHWRAEIATALFQSYGVLFFASAESFSSEYVAKELSVAEERHLPILRINLDKSRPTALNAIMLAGLQHVNLRSTRDQDALFSLEQAMRRIMEEESSEIRVVSTDPPSKARPYSQTPVRAPIKDLALLLLAVALLVSAVLTWMRHNPQPSANPSSKPSPQVAPHQRQDQPTAPQPNQPGVVGPSLPRYQLKP